MSVTDPLQGELRLLRRTSSRAAELLDAMKKDRKREREEEQLDEAEQSLKRLQVDSSRCTSPAYYSASYYGGEDFSPGPPPSYQPVAPCLHCPQPRSAACRYYAPGSLPSDTSSPVAMEQLGAAAGDLFLHTPSDTEVATALQCTSPDMQCCMQESFAV